MNSTPRATRTRLALAAVVLLTSTGTAAASSLATTIGYLGDYPGSPLGGHFDPIDGVEQSLFVRDTDRAGEWAILAGGGGEIELTDGYCGSSLFLRSKAEYTCAGALRVDLGDRNDTLVSDASRTKATGVPGLVVNAGSGRDYVRSGPLPDTVHGDFGSDTLDAGGGNDSVFGDAGDDILFGTPGADQHDGGDGTDTVNYPGLVGVVVTLNDDLANDGRAGEGDRLRNVEHVGGSQVGDRITGSTGDNRLDGHKGDDRVYGIGGSDIVLGGAGNDWLSGGSGIDTLDGGDGDDRIFARDGAYDYVTCGAGADYVEADATDGIHEASCETIVNG